jgi:hypothetical protein
MTGMTLIEAALAIPEGAACAGSGVEFVDPDPSDAPDIVRTWCWKCPVVGPCRSIGDQLAPHRHPVIFGARLFDAGEPVDGWAAETA